MSKILLGTAGGKQIGFDTDLLLRTRLLLQADSGGGKSWAIRRLAEQLFGKVQTILIDPEGEFATLREKFDFVLVGKGGETPADPRSAALVARRLLELRASAVCDLYELKYGSRHEWVKKFLDAMIEMPKELWRPVVVIVDEAHAFCPEHGKGESEALGSMIDLATKGRKRGYCAVWATQSLGKLNKDASGMLQNRLIGPTFEDVNRKRAAECLGIPPGAETRTFYAEMKVLEPGNFFALGRAICTERVMVHIGPVQTTHPEMGSGKHSAPAPPPPAKIKALLPKLSDLPKEAEEKARTESEFRQEIRLLKAELIKRTHNVQTPAAAAPDPGVTRKAIAAAVKPLEAFKHLSVLQVTRALKEFDVTRSLLVRVVEAAGNIEGIPVAPPSPTAPPPTREPQTQAVRTAPVASSPVSSPLPANSNGDAKLGRLHEQVAGILAAYHPDPMETDFLAALCGRTPGGSWSARLSEVRSAGLLLDHQPGRVIATEDCVRLFRGRFNPPQNTEEVMALWNPKLSEVHRQIMNVLIAARGEPMRTEDLAQAVGRTAGGSFSARVSEVRTKGLITDHGKGLIAANKKSLFLED